MTIRIGGTNVSLGALFGIVTTTFGVLSDPSVLAVLPAKFSSAVAIAGVIIAAVSKAVVHDPASVQ
jgi:hypothetical protein